MAREVKVTVLGDVKGFNRAVGDAEGRLGRFRTKVGSLGRGIAVGLAAGLATAAVAIGAVVVTTLKDLARIEQIGAQTDAVLRSTGGAAGVTREGVEGLAGGLERLTSVEAETIQEGANLLLTFTNLKNGVGEGNDIFDQATKAALDMSVAMGTDMSSASLLVGKALNDPLKGLTALSRAGVQFTAEQQEQIKAMVAAGDAAGAQKVILGELQTQFGGSAEALGETFTGRLDKLRNSFGELAEGIVTRLMPVAERLVAWAAEHLPGAFATVEAFIVAHLVPAFARLSAWWAENGPAILATAAQLWAGLRTGLAAVGRAVEVVLGWFRSTFGKGGEGEGTLSGFLASARPVLNTLRQTFATVFEAVRVAVTVFANVTSALWERYGERIIAHMRTAFNTLMQILDGALKIIKGVLDVFIGVFTGDWRRAWAGIKGIFEGAWQAIRAALVGVLSGLKLIITVAVDAIVGWWRLRWEFVKAVFGVVWSSMKTTAGNAIGWVRDKITEVVDGITDRWSQRWEAMRDGLAGVWTDIKITAAGAMTWLRDTISDVVDDIGDVWDGIRDAFRGPIEWVVDRVFNQGIRRAWNAVAGLIPGLSELPEIRLAFAAGGRVPGVGTRDTIPAMLTPDEIVIRREVARPHRAFLLALNDGQAEAVQAAGGRGRRFAEGGVVEAAQNFARRQVGKPYVWGGVGPAGWDCSGLLGALQNVLEAAGSIYRRRFTSASIGAGGDGWSPGSDGLYTVGTRRGVGRGSGGHVAGTLAGLNVESYGGHGPAVGSGARGSGHRMFGEVLSLAGSGGWLRDQAAAILEAAFRPLRALIDSWTAGQGAFAGMVGHTGHHAMNSTVGWVRGAEFDSGGWLEPGLNVTQNLTGRRERVVPPGGDRLVTLVAEQNRLLGQLLRAVQAGHSIELDGDRVGRAVVGRVYARTGIR